MKINVNFSTFFCLYWFFLHALAVAAGLSLSLAAVQTLMVLLIVIVHGAVGFWRYWFRRLKNIQALAHGVWVLEYANQAKIRASLATSSLVSSRFMVLHFNKQYPKGKSNEVIWPDAVSERDFKVLMRCCKQSQVARAAALTAND